jgi:hypothetical protein
MACKEKPTKRVDFPWDYPCISGGCNMLRISLLLHRTPKMLIRDLQFPQKRLRRLQERIGSSMKCSSRRISSMAPMVRKSTNTNTRTAKVDRQVLLLKVHDPTHIHLRIANIRSTAVIRSCKSSSSLCLRICSIISLATRRLSRSSLASSNAVSFSAAFARL